MPSAFVQAPALSTFFTTPRAIIADGAPPRLNGLGDGTTDFIASLAGGISKIVGSVTGANAQQDAQAAAVELAKVQAAQQNQLLATQSAKQIAEVQASSALWMKVLPIGLLVVGGVGAAIYLSRRS